MFIKIIECVVALIAIGISKMFHKNPSFLTIIAKNKGKSYVFYEKNMKIMGKIF